MVKVVHPFRRVRKQTDDSLVIERGKTDESFDEYKGNTEAETDRAVSINRLEADNARTQRRLDDDSRIDDVESDSKRIQKKRNSEDIAIDIERTKNDQAIEREREQKDRLLSKLVSSEREATDRNLLEERTKTDVETAHSERLLNLAHAAHLDTKSALTTREEFVAIVSHDLRNPIGAILSSVEILSEDLAASGIGVETKQWIEIIKRSAQTSLRLISDILDMERITEGKLQMRMDSHRLQDVLEESTQNYQHVAASKNISLRSETKNLSGAVQFDRDRVAQILSNLIGNALKFTPPGGTIVIGAEDSEEEIKVSIADTGPGIPESQKQRIFERFAQIHNKDRHGLGLGLYISKTLVESHSGKLWVVSEQGKGSTFYFTLPKRTPTH